MNRTYTRPALQRASAFLEGLISRLSAQHQFRLPVITTLAAQAGVSPFSMRKAVGLLTEKGVLTAKHGSGIHIVSPARPSITPSPATTFPAPTPREHNKTSWEQVATTLEHEILGGTYRSTAPLPRYQELCARYGVCHRTLHKALMHLVQKQILEPYKKNYRIKQPEANNAQSHIVLITSKDPNGELQHFTPRTDELLRTVKNECVGRGIGLHIVPYYRTLGSEHSALESAKLLAGFAADKSILGFMVLGAGIPDESMAYLLARLRRIGRPVSLLDENGILRPDSSASSCVKLFSMASSPACAESVARHLLALGHRRIAYLSLYHATQWSMQRLDGVIRACAGLCGTLGVIACTDDRYSSAWETVKESTAVQAAIEKHLRDCVPPGKAADTLLLQTLESLIDTIAPTIELVAPLRYLKPLFNQALSSHATAWVCSNDTTALAALNFLRDNGCSVPQEISVIGFDDSTAAVTSGLSSFNFNVAAYAHGMLSHIVYQKYPASIRNSGAPVEFDGFVNARMSTGQVCTGDQQSPAAR